MLVHLPLWLCRANDYMLFYVYFLILVFYFWPDSGANLRVEPTWEWKKPLNRGLQVNCLMATKPGLPFQIWRPTYRLQRASTAFKCECECHHLCPYLDPTNWWPVKEVADLWAKRCYRLMTLHCISIDKKSKILSHHLWTSNCCL